MKFSIPVTFYSSGEGIRTYYWGPNHFVDFVQTANKKWSVLISENVEKEGLTSTEACESWFAQNKAGLQERYFYGQKDLQKPI